MRTPFLTRFAALAAERGIAMHRFAFSFMADAGTGRRRPPPRAESLVAEYRAAVDALPADLPLLIGGKSLGGRVASLLADTLHGTGRIAGLICLGYPLHPPKQPEKLRMQHLLALACPALIVQGERDPLGTRTQFESLSLSPSIRFAWMPDGDHDFRARRAFHAHLDNLAAAADAVAAFGADLLCAS